MWSPAAGSPPPILVRAVFRMYPKVVVQVTLDPTSTKSGWSSRTNSSSGTAGRRHVWSRTCPSDWWGPNPWCRRVSWSQGGARRNFLPKGDGTSRLLAFIMGLLESMGQNSYPPQAGTASKHPPVVPKSKKWNRKQTTKWPSQTTPHSSSHATMPQSEKLSHERRKEGINNGNQVDVWL